MGRRIGKIRIELISDMCASDGDIYNSSIDTDICYDTLGLPYIPAKRIKGIMREIAEEFFPEQTQNIFGGKGRNGAKMQLSNALLDDYESKRKSLMTIQNEVIAHPQNVLREFTYIRTQTAIDKESGSADETSLRTMRVLKKGLFFNAQIAILDTHEEVIKQIVKGMRHLGMNRTRGMGEIKATVTFEDEKAGNKVLKTAVEKDKMYRIPYTISLQSALLLKNVMGGQTRTMDYIEGAKILGMIANSMTKEEYLALSSEAKMKCSNAYISRKGIRALPIPKSLYKCKDQKKEQDGSLKLMDMAVVGSTDKQASPYGDGYYVKAEKCQTINVETQIGYYHERPKDKSIGRAVDSFYQMESICKEQEFSGYIEVLGSYCKQIYEILCNKQNLRMGYSRNSEFGEVELCVREPEPIAISQSIQPGKTFVVTLQAPVIIYDENGNCSTNIEDLMKEISRKLGVEVMLDKNSNAYINNTVIGGYQTKWHMRKPNLHVFDKGTVLICQSSQEVACEAAWIGERNAEGYGEITIAEKSSEEHVYMYEAAVADEKQTLVVNAFVSKLAYQRVRETIVKNAIEDAKGVFKGTSEKEMAVISKLLIIYDEQPDEEGFYQEVSAIVDEKKNEYADKIKNLSYSSKLNEKDIAEWRFLTEEDKKKAKQSVYQWYVGALLTQGKRIIVRERDLAKKGAEAYE